MRRRKMEKLVLLPFSVGCISESSVAVGLHSHKYGRTTKPQTKGIEKEVEEDEHEEIISEESTKNPQRLSAIPKPNIAVGFHRLYKGFKNFSQLFVYKEEMEEMEMDMEIGTPTDVKHVTHIGCDGSTRDANPLIGWESLLASELLSVPSSTSWRNFDELSMASRATDLPLVHKPI